MFVMFFVNHRHERGQKVGVLTSEKVIESKRNGVESVFVVDVKMNPIVDELRINRVDFVRSERLEKYAIEGVVVLLYPVNRQFSVRFEK